MTFFFTVIMKRKTLVCQFASPLDVDVHNTPQVWSCFEKQKAHLTKSKTNCVVLLVPKKHRPSYLKESTGRENAT